MAVRTGCQSFTVALFWTISGFVDFKHKRDAKDAVKDLNGKKLRGCRIRLEMSDGPGGSRKKGGDYDSFSYQTTVSHARLLRSFFRSSKWKSKKNDLSEHSEIYFK